MNTKELLNTLTAHQYNNKQALSLSDELFENSLNEKYKTVDRAELFAAFKDLLERKSPRYGMISLVEEERISGGDIREILIHRPTHCVLAWGIYLMNTEPKLFDEKTDMKFETMLEKVFQNGIFGHGIDGFVTIRQTIMIYAKAGMYEFIVENSEYAPSFTTYMNDFLSLVEKIGSSDNPEGRFIRDSGYASNAVNNYLRYIKAVCMHKPYLIFVYGTLMKGQSAHSMLGNGIYCDKFLLKDYAMYNLSRYPGIKEKENETVQGEGYFVDEGMLKDMDAYEGEGSLYDRKEVIVESIYGDLRAFVYVYKGNPTGDIQRTKWNSHPNDKVWYAVYGSNLDPFRFVYYILGGECDVNGKVYEGCRNRTLWSDTETTSFPGQLYFAKSSRSWNNKGVAFFDERIKHQRTYMRLYKITLEQLEDVHRQEGWNWYKKMVCLGIHKDGSPIYTLTNEERLPSNQPDDRYLELLKKALKKDHIQSKRELENYIKQSLK